MKMKKPKKMIEAKREDVVLMCSLGKSSMFVMRRMSNGKYESKWEDKKGVSLKIFEKSADALERVKQMIEEYEQSLKSDDIVETEKEALESEEEV